jgi:hypothetical protein
MKSKILIFLFFMSCFSCSKKDPKVSECPTGGITDNCFEITENNLTGANGYVPIIFKNLKNEIMLVNSLDNVLMAFDVNLKMLWQKSFLLSQVNDVIQNEFGNILMVSTMQGQYSQVAKLNDSGDVLWKITIKNDSIPQYHSIARTHEKDGYLISGTVFSTSESLPIVTKIGEYGEVQWSKVIHEDFPQRIHDILEVPNGYIILEAKRIRLKQGMLFTIIS